MSLRRSPKACTYSGYEGVDPPNPRRRTIGCNLYLHMGIKQLRFRTRLFVILFLFALIPAAVLTALWSGTVTEALPLLSGGAAWDRVAVSGQHAIESLDNTHLTAKQRAALDEHQRELSTAVEQSRRLSFIVRRTVNIILIAAIIALILLGIAASKVAGHLSRQLSRPIMELLNWTDKIQQGEPLPGNKPARGAPEFAALRSHMRDMASAIEAGRERELEAERLRAFRESARQVAHELKNPLTPIRFAIGRLRKEAPESLHNTIDVLEAESQRLDRMARSFAQFGKLPEGTPSEVDISEMVRYSAQSTVPEHITLEMNIDSELPTVTGYHDALAGALSNVIINAVEACNGQGKITVSASVNNEQNIEITVSDTGKGIPADRLQHIWDPYVTGKAGGTGLGLAIARQAIEAHHGAVEATSTVGSGTQIKFKLPVNG